MPTHYYHGSIRKYTSIVGTIFNDISLVKYDSGGSELRRIKVPLSYGPSMKWHFKLDRPYNNDKGVRAVPPRISYEMTGMTYRANDQLIPTGYSGVSSTAVNDETKTIRNAVPYDIEYRVDIWVANYADGSQIVEQILPYFKPEWTQTITLISDPIVKKDIPLILSGVDLADEFEGDFETKRAINWNLTFILKGWLYPAVQDKTQIIRQAQVDMYTDYDETANTVSQKTANTARVERNRGVPFIQGTATDDIMLDDDFGFDNDIYNYADARRYDPVTGTDIDI